MKMSVIFKLLAALAAVAGIIYVIATYGDKIVAWAKKLLGQKNDACECDCDFQCEADCDECPCEADCDECPCCGECDADETAEEVVEDSEPAADEADFEA